MSSVQSDLRYALYGSQAEWNDSGGSTKFSNMLEASRTVPYPSEFPRTLHTIRIKFTEFPRIDSRRPFVEIQLLLDRGLRLGQDLSPWLAQPCEKLCLWPYVMGGGPRVVVSTAAFHARVRGSVPGLGGLKETKLFLPHPRVKVSIVGSLRDREVACSASDRQGSNFESCVWRTVSSQSSHHPQEVLLAQFSLYVHKGGLKPDSFPYVMPKQF